jgi:hypothetical protein
MRGAVLHAPGDVRFEEREDPKIIEPTDAIIRMSVTCVCGSDLWDYRGINSVTGHPGRPRVLRHSRGGRQRGRDHQARQFVIGSFFASDGTCPLPGRLPERMPASKSSVPSALGEHAGPARRRDAGHEPGSLTTICCPACSPPRMCWVLAGSPRLLPMCSAA